jgi:hypothetical protein
VPDVLSAAPQTPTPHATKDMLALARTELALADRDTHEGRTIARTVGILIAAVEQMEAEHLSARMARYVA